MVLTYWVLCKQYQQKEESFVPQEMDHHLHLVSTCTLHSEYLLSWNRQRNTKLHVPLDQREKREWQHSKNLEAVVWPQQQVKAGRQVVVVFHIIELILTPCQVIGVKGKRGKRLLHLSITTFTFFQEISFTVLFYFLDFSKLIEKSLNTRTGLRGSG